MAIIQPLSNVNKADVIFIADACHAGKLAGSAVNGTQATARALSSASDDLVRVAKIMSCQPNEFSREGREWGGGHSVFTYYLIDGIIGLADTDGDNKVSLFELQNYLQTNVRKAVAPSKQLPLVTGNLDLVMARVDPEAKQKLLEEKNPGLAEQPTTQPTLTKAPAAPPALPGDSLTLARYKLFGKALEQKHFLYPEKESAYALYMLLKDNESIAPFLPQMRDGLVSGLQDEAQKAINDYLAASPEELSRRWSYDTVYQYYPQYLEKAAELLGPQHFSFTDLKAKQLYFEGLNLRLKGEREKDPTLFSAAQQRQELVLMLSPNAPYAFNELGLLARRNGKYQESITYFNKALEVAPTWPLAQTNLCGSLLDLDHIDEAIIHCNLAIESDSLFAQAYYNLGVAYREKTDYKQAISNYRNSIRLDSNYVNAYFKLGSAYYFIGEKEKAKEMWQTCIQKQPNSPEAFNNLAALAMENGDFPKALTLLNEATRIKPNYTSALYDTALVLGQLKENEKSLDALQAALASGYKRKQRILDAPELEQVRELPRFQQLMQQYFPE
ncbi:MAG: tetratricopeptide repeat protein [Lewinellaceae bacterium]|nr:tetratricopeptide repeat protein [Lewinellaceae bacterium]